MLQLRSAYTIILFAGAVAILPPTAEGLREFGTWCLRPGRLPFAWKSMQDASKKGDAKEVFARGQQILQLVPSWTDGHSAMVYNYVLTHDVSEDQAATAAAAEKRLLTGIQRLEDARQFAAGRDHVLVVGSKGELVALGDNERGQLGLGDEGLARSDVPTLVPPLPAPVSKAACGASHSGLLLADGADASHFSECRFIAGDDGRFRSQ